jgi:hypothetical protein
MIVLWRDAQHHTTDIVLQAGQPTVRLVGAVVATEDIARTLLQVTQHLTIIRVQVTR